MAVKEGAPIPFREGGIAYSHVPRDRGMERSSATIENGRHFFEAMDREEAHIAYYVILTNRNGASPDSSYKLVRDIFRNQQTIASSINLDGENGAILDLVATTAPYAAGNGERHLLCFVTRNGNVPTFGELNSEEMINFHKMIGLTLDYMEHTSENGTASYIGFSSSPLESLRVAQVFDPISQKEETILFPRSPAQNIATIHGHIVTLRPENLVDHPDSKKLFDERMVREPRLESLTEIFRTTILEPVIEQFPDLAVTYGEHVENDGIFPKGSFLSLDRQDLQNPRFGQLIHALHQQAERVYFRIADTTVDAQKLYKGEVIMRSRDEVKSNVATLLATPPFSSLSDRTRRFIKIFGRMKDPNEMASPYVSFRERAKIAESFVLLGLAYNIVYYYPKSNPDKAVVAIEPRWLSGASPTETMGIFKDQTYVTTSEFQPIRERNMETAKQLGLYLFEKLLTT